MKILFKNANILNENGEELKASLAVSNDKISYIGNDIPNDDFDRVINCENYMLIPGLYNTHTHAAMTLFRGYGEDLPLQRWLNEKIFPAEDRLHTDAVYYASMLAIAEMIKNGVVSFSDMYFFCDTTANAVEKTGIKANISRCLVSFDDTISADNDMRFIEAKALYDNYHKKCDGRINIDMALHAVYSIMPNTCKYVREFALEKNIPIQIHLSETKKENDDCIAKYGKTPTEFFNSLGLFDAKVTAAHSVYINDSDMDILAAKGVTVAHNPISNLKLGSGVMPLYKMLDKGINVTLGTDGAASNNTLDILKEAYTAAILHKGITLDPSYMKAKEFMPIMTKNAALSQNRENSGELKIGSFADIVLLDMNDINAIPSYSLSNSLIYSMNSSNVKLTMVNGKILYENGNFTTIDIEDVKYNFKKILSTYFLDK